MDILTWILGLISAFFAVKWQTSAKENEGLKQRLNGKKEVLYTEFLSFYMSVIDNKQDEKSIEKGMKDFNKRMMLTASNEVYLTFGDLMQSSYKPEKDSLGIRLMGELILSMRKDLGHSDWINTLYWFDPLRPWLKDINDFIPKKYRTSRRQYDKAVNVMKT